MKKLFLENLSLVLGAFCLFGVPALTLALMAWGGDYLVALLPEAGSDEPSPLFALEAVAAMGLTALGALIFATVFFVGLRRLSIRLQHAADQETPPDDAAHSVAPPIESQRIRVGLMVTRKGLSSIREVQKRYGRSD